MHVCIYAYACMYVFVHIVWLKLPLLDIDLPSAAMVHYVCTCVFTCTCKYLWGVYSEAPPYTYTQAIVTALLDKDLPMAAMPDYLDPKPRKGKVCKRMYILCTYIHMHLLSLPRSRAVLTNIGHFLCVPRCVHTYRS
jgi:hypothetical protein